jgi:hypothetical protein
LGVVDHFTNKIIPTTATYVQEMLFPPRFFVSFTPSTNLSGGLTVSSLHDASINFTVTRTKPDDPVFMVLAGPGSYILHLRGAGDKAGKVLVDQRQIGKSGEIWPANEAERNWVNPLPLSSGAETAGAASASGQATPAGASRLSNTRWTVTEQDYAVLTQVDNKIRRALLSNALGEVGIYEYGTEWEKQHIASYGAAAGPPYSGPPYSTLQQGFPWGGAFLAWVLTQAYVKPPTGNVSYLSWQRWAADKPSTSIEPGMIGIFKLDTAEIPQSQSRLLVGAIIRRQPNCIETIVGNISDRVVITCIAEKLFLTSRGPDQ